jgi:hypothetical protein
MIVLRAKGADRSSLKIVPSFFVASCSTSLSRRRSTEDFQSPKRYQPRSLSTPRIFDVLLVEISGFYGNVSFDFDALRAALHECGESTTAGAFSHLLLL